MKHPNAIVGGAGGVALGPAIVELLGLFGVEISGTLGAVVGGVAGGLVLLVGREGFVGVWRLLKYGAAGSRG